jgi:hypothetical protein
MTSVAKLNFDLLDELAYSLSLKSPTGVLPQIIAPQNLGPLIELEWLRTNDIPLPCLTSFTASRRLRLINAAISGRRVSLFEGEGSCARVVCCYWQKDEETDDWYYFCKSMEQSALMIGFPRRNAEELVASIRELVANIYDHSGAPQTGIVGYAANNNELEFVVADRGMGVLNSLRMSSDFRALRDAGEALEAALTDGTSRYGKASGHGGGFRDLFRGLLNLSSALRFRSGDHALTINGITPGLSMGRISQKVQLPGFVISVVCIR